MIPYLVLVLLPIHVTCARVSQTHGVSPDLLSLYSPSSSSPPTWKCLNESLFIPWTAVNDDYCDCPDGSDEPGTGACPDTTFYCVNEGHIGARISSTRVNDGICEAECCDGSDEAPGVCPNRCKEIGEEYRKRVAAEKKVRKTGSKIRSTYIAFAHKEKKRLEESVALLEKDIVVQEKEVARLKDIMERTESISAAALNHKKESPLYQSLITHKSALKSLQKVYQRHVEREKQLGDILEALKGGYNPNYQDMAVLEAVKGWEALSGEKTEEEVPATSDASAEDRVWTEDQLKYQLDPLLSQDYVALLLSHDNHLRGDTTSLLFDISSYLPEAIVPRYEWMCATILDLLRTVGVLRGTVVSNDESSRARDAFTDAESKLDAAKERIRDEREEIAELFDPEGFGIEGEWKKLQGLCFSTESGGYTYEVCLFGDATQRGGGTHSLGKYSSWSRDPNTKPGDPRYYQTQHYTNGAKCWNGPERSVTLHLSCGTENKILSVAEPEKCEYHMTATTPALCLPLGSGEGQTREEL
ncbi:glucosidase II beta subunit-like-domain-containing protein [Hysterangium stoloniferum]|nr:glucosidase II beta subunit-like-domain-containing protein [Hysterangium stoloniferum]